MVVKALVVVHDCATLERKKTLHNSYNHTKLDMYANLRSSTKITFLSQSQPNIRQASAKITSHIPSFCSSMNSEEIHKKRSNTTDLTPRFRQTQTRKKKKKKKKIAPGDFNWAKGRDLRRRRTRIVGGGVWDLPEQKRITTWTRCLFFLVINMYARMWCECVGALALHPFPQ